VVKRVAIATPLAEEDAPFFRGSPKGKRFAIHEDKVEVPVVQRPSSGPIGVFTFLEPRGDRRAKSVTIGSTEPATEKSLIVSIVR
jgi:hypothetical protein